MQANRCRLTPSRKLFATSVFLLLLCAGVAGAQSLPVPVYRVGPDRAGVVSLEFAGHKVPLSGNGGFRVFDVTGKQEVVLGKATVKTASGGSAIAMQSGSVRLMADFSMHGSYIQVDGTIENLKTDDRGYIVDYLLPVSFDAPVFSSDVTQQISIAAGKEYESNAFPLAALVGRTEGVAMAIPPSAPCDFGFVGDGKGLTVRFYLGTTPKAKLFPSKATFSFIVYAVEPSWGFRSALSRYYKFFPDFYTPRLKKDGLYMVATGSNVPANASQYAFELYETQIPTHDVAMARNQKYDITTFPYMIVGQREIKFLPALPKTYQQAMAAFARWTADYLKGHVVRKEFACTEGDVHIEEEVKTSGVKLSDGRFSVVVRNTEWGGNSVTFRVNPSPYLFEGQNLHTVGADAMRVQDDWINHHPEYGGMFVDSLGSNWPSVLNYREDHFPYAQYPLTVDSSGRVAIDNSTSHYEYVNLLRKKVRAKGRLVNANGVYAFMPRARAVTPKPSASGEIAQQIFDFKQNEFLDANTLTEHYRSNVKLSRFFLAALLDVGSNERGIKSSVEDNLDLRTMMGSKQFALINYDWQNAAQIEEFLNKSLCFGIFASTANDKYSPLNGVADPGAETYNNSPNGYARDKKLLDWYVPLADRISKSGWEPVRYAQVEGKGVYSERYGSGNAVYFTVYNDSDRTQTATLQIDLKSLGFPEGNVMIREIARHQKVEKEGGQARLTVESKKTYILQLSERS